jgi:RNA polymerase sigma-70 factor (ECF subfamily)
MTLTTATADITPPSKRRVPDAAERAAILRALTVWIGDAIAAEDLTQQTLLAAWSSARQPAAEGEWRPWLFGIARTMLLRWRREQARHGRRVAPAPESERHLMAASSGEVIDAIVEREDVVAILDGALARIPAESRAALLLRYVEELPQREVAARLGIGEGALEGKLHRGKRAMGRILLTERGNLAASMGLLAARDTWFSTDIWCEYCGKQRLVARWTEGGDLWMDCPACWAAPMNGSRNTLFRNFDAAQGIRSRFGEPSTTPPRDVMRNLSAGIYEATADGLDTVTSCARCGGTVQVSIVPEPPDQLEMPPDIKAQCTRCGCLHLWSWSTASCGSHPLVLDWLARQERVRMTTQKFVTTIDNRPATLARFESVTSSSTITAWRDLGTMKFVLIERNGVAIDPATVP